MTAEQVKAALQQYANPEDALFLQRFFKTGTGEYGEGDVFIGVRVPQTRRICKQFADLQLSEVQKLLKSPVHEHRLSAVIILANAYNNRRATEFDKQKIYELYLKNVYEGRVNNWDIIDLSAPKIIGMYLLDRPRDLLFELAQSDDLWQRRVAALSTFQFIIKGDPSTSLEIAEVLLRDKQDLIQKAVGWMLREVGKRCEESLLTTFLDKHAHEMPRTMLRYSIEKLKPEQKAYYMKRKAS